MRIIKQLTDDIRGNIDEARAKIDAAYLLRDTNRQAADWYKSMAAAHLDFNNAGHAAVSKAISDYKASGQASDLAPGMMAVYADIHADLIKRTAEVRFMIDQFAK